MEWACNCFWSLIYLTVNQNVVRTKWSSWPDIVWWLPLHDVFWTLSYGVFFFIAMKSGEVQEGKSHMAGLPFLPGRKESSAIGWSIAQQLWCGCKRGTMTVKAKCWHWSKKYSNNGLTRMKGGKTDVMFHQYRSCKNNL